MANINPPPTTKTTSSRLFIGLGITIGVLVVIALAAWVPNLLRLQSVPSTPTPGSPTTVLRTFNTSDEIRAFVNSLSQSLVPQLIPTGTQGAGALFDDTATAQAICTQVGYRTFVSKTNDFFRSCGDNILAYWNGSQFIWETANACAKGSHYIATLTCSRQTACADGTDNDGDGLVDTADTGCSSPSDDDESNAPTAPPTTQCNNGTDDDGDGLVDTKDPGCSSENDTTEGDGTSQCQDGQDNDNDGKVDLDDPGCENAQDNTENSEGAGDKAQCSDGEDNDNDGKVDKQDPDCHTDGNAKNDLSYDSERDSESPSSSVKPQCADGKDNDGDGRADAADSQCHTDGNPKNSASYSKNRTNEKGPVGFECTDSVDNDGDGGIDGGDPQCHSDGNAGNPSSYNPRMSSEGVTAAAPRPAAPSNVRTGPGDSALPLLALVAALIATGAVWVARRSTAS